MKIYCNKILVAARNKEFLRGFQNMGSNTQSTAYETYILIVPSFFYTISSNVLSTHLCLLEPSIKAFLLEFLVMVVPTILNVSILSDYNHEIIFCYVILLIILAAVIKKYPQELGTKPVIIIPESTRKSCITNARSNINLISVICILTVDFESIFPIRFGKQNTGFSLMDVGVGLYVYANGIVAPEVRGKENPLEDTVKSCACLIFLGLMRMAFVILTDYPVNELEYGIHWNFFITLAVTKMLASFILNVLTIEYIYVTAISITFIYQGLLEMNVKKLVFSYYPRLLFVAANREGIVSSIGFTALYLFSSYFGYCFSKQKTVHKSNLVFFLWSVLTLILTSVLCKLFGISRRLADAAYIFWILFVGISMTWLFYLAENIAKDLFRNRVKKVMFSPHIFEAINYNGLIFFLLGNLSTGFINMLTNCSKFKEYNAIVVVVAYMFLNCFVIVKLYIKQIKFKL